MDQRIQLIELLNKGEYTDNINTEENRYHFWTILAHGNAYDNIKDRQGLLFKVPGNAILISPNVCGMYGFAYKLAELKYLVNPLSFVDGSLFTSKNKLFQEYGRHAKVYDNLARNSSLKIDSRDEESSVVQGVFLTSTYNISKDTKQFYKPIKNSPDFKKHLNEHNIDYLDLTDFFVPNKVTDFKSVVNKIADLDKDATNVIVYFHCEGFPEDLPEKDTQKYLAEYAKADATSFPLKNLQLIYQKNHLTVMAGEPAMDQFQNSRFDFGLNPFITLYDKRKNPRYRLHKKTVVEKIKQLADKRELKQFVQRAKTDVDQLQEKALQSCEIEKRQTFQVEGIKYILLVTADGQVIVRKHGREAEYFRYKIEDKSTWYYINTDYKDMGELFKGKILSMDKLMRHKVFSSSLLKAIKCIPHNKGVETKIGFSARALIQPSIAQLILKGKMTAPHGYKTKLYLQQMQRQLSTCEIEEPATIYVDNKEFTFRFSTAAFYAPNSFIISVSKILTIRLTYIDASKSYKPELIKPLGTTLKNGTLLKKVHDLSIIKAMNCMPDGFNTMLTIGGRTMKSYLFIKAELYSPIGYKEIIQQQPKQRSSQRRAQPKRQKKQQQQQQQPKTKRQKKQQQRQRT